MRALADLLFGLFESGSFGKAVELFDPNAVVKQYFGPGNGRPIPIQDFEKSVSALVAAVGAPRYLNRRVVEHDNGFIEQHTSQLNGLHGIAEIDVCVVVETNAAGKIISLEEYLDPAPLSRKSKTLKKKKKNKQQLTPKDTLGPDACCVIVGATSGIGKEIALWYAKRGCAVVLAGRREVLLEKVADQCRSLHPACRALSVRTDITVAEDCKNLIQRTLANFGHPARLVLNSGISQNATLLDSGPSLVRQQLETNFFGFVEITSAALPHMLEFSASSALHPRIVVVSSALGLLAAPKNTGYVASKAALHGFYESLRCEVGDKITISLVAPGPVDTPILSALAGPKGTKVALDLDESARTSLMSAQEAARLTVEACESGTPLLVFLPSTNFCH